MPTSVRGVVNVAGGPWAAGTTRWLTMQLVDWSQKPIPGSALATMTLTLVDTLSQVIINGVEQTNILNTGRGVIDQQGNLTITLSAADTAMTETTAPQVQRSAIIDWTYNAGASVGRQPVNFMLVALAAP